MPKADKIVLVVMVLLVAICSISLILQAQEVKDVRTGLSINLYTK